MANSVTHGITKIFGGLCFFLIVVSAPSAVHLAASGWPQFRGNPRLTGVGSEVPANLSLKWTYEGGESFESSPVIADSVVSSGAGTAALLALFLATPTPPWHSS